MTDKVMSDDVERVRDAMISTCILIGCGLSIQSVDDLARAAIAALSPPTEQPKAKGRCDKCGERIRNCTCFPKTTEQQVVNQGAVERLREALQAIADRPGCGMGYAKGCGEWPIDEGEHCAEIARAALSSTNTPLEQGPAQP